VKPKRYTVAVDFDGVIHSYSSPWIAAHVIPDPPVENSIAWLHTTLQSFDIVIFTTRGKTWRGRRAVRRWLYAQANMLWYPAPGYRGLEEIRVTDRKVAALIYLDDRAIRFDGANFPSKDEIHGLRPWNKPK
jgi:hypothetical protein